MRRGTWFTYSAYCRSAYRLWDDPGCRDNTIGCRVVLSLD
jgi:formylglycine-generating enzyme required for sulfatase activity